MAEIAANKQRGRPFQKGQSGNPKGKAKGCRNKASRIVQELLEGEAETLTRKLVEKAKEGDVACLRMCMERLCPPRRDTPLTSPLPKVAGLESLPKASQAVLNKVGKGELTPKAGQDVVDLIEAHGRILGISESEADEDQQYSVATPEEMAERAAKLRAKIEQQRTEFLPQRRAEIQEMKEGLGRLGFDSAE